MEPLQVLEYGPTALLAAGVVALWRANQKLLAEKERLLEIVISHIIKGADS